MERVIQIIVHHLSHQKMGRTIVGGIYEDKSEGAQLAGVRV